MSYRSRLLCILSIKALFMIYFIQQNIIELGPDEAQYWTWSQALDFGYYSKPPGIAWQIALGCYFFGQSELGIRISAICFSSLLSYLIFATAKQCRLKEREAYYAALAFCLSPIGIFGALLTTTDGGLLFFWTLSSLPLLKALSEDKTPNYMLIGFFIGCGALFKWAIYIYWIVIVCFMVFTRNRDGKYLIPGILISLIGLLPSLYWNMQHEFATFKHVLTTMTNTHDGSGSSYFIQGNFLSFFGAQWALVSPILFGLLLHQFYTSKEESPPLYFCKLSTLIILGCYLFLSLFKKMQGNWALFAYPLSFIYLASASLNKHEKLFKKGLVLSASLSTLTLSLPLLPLPYKLNPFRHNLGWDHVEKSLAQENFQSDHHFLLGDSYQMSSLLSFYNSDKKRAYFLNLNGIRKNQFSFWPQNITEKEGFYLFADNAPHYEKFNIENKKNDLETYFENVAFIKEIPLVTVNEKIVKKGFLFHCGQFKGIWPHQELDKF